MDGFSLKPFLLDPDSKNWSGPDAALTAINKWGDSDPVGQSYALRSQQWRYIRYHNGDEELYDCLKDPYEWHNLAVRDEYAPILEKFRNRLEARINL